MSDKIMKGASREYSEKFDQVDWRPTVDEAPSHLVCSQCRAPFEPSFSIAGPKRSQCCAAAAERVYE